MQVLEVVQCQHVVELVSMEDLVLVIFQDLEWVLRQRVLLVIPIGTMRRASQRMRMSCLGFLWKGGAIGVGLFVQGVTTMTVMMVWIRGIIIMDRDHHLVIIIIIIIIMGMDMGTDMDMDTVAEMTDYVVIHVAIIMIIIMMTDAVAVVARNGSDMIHIIGIVQMDVGIINIMVRGVRMTIIHHRGM